jgi:hypothetical protein
MEDGWSGESECALDQNFIIDLLKRRRRREKFPRFRERGREEKSFHPLSPPPWNT